MNEVSQTLHLPAPLKAAAERMAQRDGVSLNQWVASAVAQKIGAVDAVQDFFARRAGRSQPADLNNILALVPGAPAKPGDELPPGR